MNDAIITDNERINIEPKDVMVKGSNKKQGVNAQTSTNVDQSTVVWPKLLLTPAPQTLTGF